MRQFDIEIENTIRFTDPQRAKGGIWALDLNTAYVPDKVRKHWRNKLKE